MGIIIAILLLIGILSRILFIDKQPNALNVDEASSGYEAWSILNYGIDRNGNFLPVFLISWGSGQNALYSYLMIPCVKLLGLNTLSVRMPMAVIGSISLIVFYLLIKELKNEKVAIIGLAFFILMISMASPLIWNELLLLRMHLIALCRLFLLIN